MNIPKNGRPIRGLRPMATPLSCQDEECDCDNDHHRHCHCSAEHLGYARDSSSFERRNKKLAGLIIGFDQAQTNAGQLIKKLDICEPIWRVFK
jgi:hypothetical protein